jgi:predicted Ser/Thr protein kinase
VEKNPIKSAPGPQSQEPQQTGSGAYRLGQQLRQSMSASVYLAQAVADGRTVVVKQPTSASAAEHEAALLRRLNGEGAPVLLSSDTLAGRPALVMERVSGRSLLDLVRENAQLARSPRFRRILDGMASALAALHGHDVVHGDLKPDHVIVGDNDEICLIDFSAALADVRQLPGTGDRAWLTPGFAAPEQLAADAPPDARSDIFAFGAVAFWAATGRVPPNPGNSAGVRAIDGLLRDAHLPEDMHALILACLQPSPQDRPRDAATLRDLLAGRASVTPEPAPARDGDPDEVPPTVLVRRRRIGTPTRGSGAGGGQISRQRRNAGRLMLWLFLLVLVAGTAAAGVWQGRPLYEKHFKTTWLIDADGGGDAATLAEAIARAGSDVTFLLAPGEYAGAVLRKGVYRVQPAESDADPPVILAGVEGCLGAVDTRLSLSGLIFRGVGGEGGRPCIEQSGGELSFLGNVMENVSGPGIVVRGGTSARVAESELHSIGGDAIRIEGDSGMELHDTKIVGAGGNAVTAKSGAGLTMRRNRITESAGTGVLLIQGAQARLEADLVQGSAASAIEAASGARVEARDVTLSASGGAGIFLHGESQLRMADSRVSDNALSGVFIDGAARVDVHDSVITNNGEHGILSLGALAGRLDRNDIGLNGGYGLVLDSATRVEVGDNILDSNGAGSLLDAREREGGGETIGDGAE